MALDRPGHDRRYLLDSTKLRREPAGEPTWDFEVPGPLLTPCAGTPRTARVGALRERAPVEETAWR